MRNALFQKVIKSTSILFSFKNAVNPLFNKGFQRKFWLYKVPKFSSLVHNLTSLN